LIRQLDSFGNDLLQLLQRRVVMLNNVLINVLGTVDMLCYRNFQYVCGMHIVGIELKWSTFFYAPFCISMQSTGLVSAPFLSKHVIHILINLTLLLSFPSFLVS